MALLSHGNHTQNTSTFNSYIPSEASKYLKYYESYNHSHYTATYSQELPAKGNLINAARSLHNTIQYRNYKTNNKYNGMVTIVELHE